MVNSVSGCIIKSAGTDIDRLISLFFSLYINIVVPNILYNNNFWEY